jgi:hypothetical protein
MSVVVAVAARDGLAIAADSRTLQMDESTGHYRTESDTAEKLFVIQDRFLVGTHGLAEIGERSIRALMEQFRPGVVDGPQALASALGDFFEAELSRFCPPPRREMRLSDIKAPLAFVVAGYDSEGIGRIIDVLIRPGGARTIRARSSTENVGVTPRGQTDAIERLLAGVDFATLKKVKVPLSDEAAQRLELLRYELIGLTTPEDALRIAEDLVRIQIDVQNFTDGVVGRKPRVPGCGGLIRSALVTRGGASWVRNPGRELVTTLPRHPARLEQAS